MKRLYSEDALEAVVYFFEQCNGWPVDPYSLELINSHSLVGADPEQIVESLIDIVRNEDSLSVDYRTLIYWALSKRFDKSLITFFTERLAVEVLVGSTAIYQILIALSNIDEEVFGSDRDGSFSSLDMKLNLRDAKQYLKRIS